MPDASRYITMVPKTAPEEGQVIQRSIQVTQLVSMELGLEVRLSKFGTCPSRISITLELVNRANLSQHSRPTDSGTPAWDPAI